MKRRFYIIFTLIGIFIIAASVGAIIMGFVQQKAFESILTYLFSSMTTIWFDICNIVLGITLILSGTIIRKIDED